MSDFETIIRDPKVFGDRLLDLKNRKIFCDAEIIVGEERIAVHKTVLASSSAHFEKILIKNESKAEIIMENIDLEIVQSLVEYCYTGILSVSEKKLREILPLAIFLEMTPIIEGGVKILEKKMDPSNCISTWKLTRSGNLENLKNIAFEYARQNFENVSRSTEFLDLNYPDILELLKSDIVVSCEIVAFDSVKKWINHENASRKKYINELSNFIRFENLPKNILLSDSNNLCFNNLTQACHDKILNALQKKENNSFGSADNSFRDSYSTLTVIGSNWDETKNMEIFDLKNEKWTKIKKFTFDTVAFSAVLLGHKLMLIGGMKKIDIVATVQSYDLSTGTTENMPSMKYARNRLSAVQFKGRVYVIGGYNGNWLSSVEMWDPVPKTWKELSSMSIPREDCEAKVLDKEIFVVGGYDGTNYFSDTESYNPITNIWRKCASMKQKRRAPGVTVFGNYLYVVGGMSEGDVYLNTAERYDPKINKWTEIQSLSTDKYLMGAGNLMGKFVIVGGYSKGKSVSTMEVYDDEKDDWTSMASLNDPRSFLRVVEIPWKLAKAVLSREDSI